MDQVINSLPALLRVAGDVEEVALMAARAAWGHVVGEVLRNHTLATDFREKRLSVVVSDAVWQRQLESMSGPLLYRLNSLMGDGAITFIEFRIDPGMLDSRSRKSQETERRADAVEPIPVELISAAASIRSPELRRALLGAASSALRRKSQ